MIGRRATTSPGSLALARARPRNFVDTIRRLRIRCDLRPCDSVYYTLTPDHAPALQREFNMRKAAGLGGRWLPEAEVRRLIGLDHSVAIRTTGNAQADPYRACLGFIHAAVGRVCPTSIRTAITRAIYSRRDTAGTG